MKETNFKLSPLGPIPHDWEISSLGEIISFITDFTANGSFADLAKNVPYYTRNGYARLVRLTDIRANFSNEGIYISEPSYNYLSKSKLFGGELLVANVGAYAGYSFTVPRNLNLRLSLAPNMFLIRCNNEIVSSKYEYYLFAYGAVFSQLTKKAISSAQPKINKDAVRNTLCFYPKNIIEQGRIAGALSDVDELIATTEALLQKKRDIKQGTMQQLLSGKRRLPGFSQPWENKTLKDIFKIGNGRDFKHLGKGSVPVFGTGGIIAFVDDYLMDGETICIGRKGTLDKPFYFNGKIWTVDTLFYTYDFENTDAKFLSYIISCIPWNNKSEATGVPSLNKTIILRETVYVPSLIDEQQAIAKVLADMDYEIEALKNSLTKYKAIREAMMQQLLTGKIRLI